MEQEIIERLERIERNTETAAKNAALAAKTILTFDDAVIFTGLAKSTLYRLTCTGKIPHYKPRGQRIYFDRAELEAWLKSTRGIDAEAADRNATNYVVNGKATAGEGAA
jgi:excisionase family DNA binding protein